MARKSDLKEARQASDLLRLQRADLLKQNSETINKLQAKTEELNNAASRNNDLVREKQRLTGSLQELEEDYQEASDAKDEARRDNLDLVADNKNLADEVLTLDHDLEVSAATNAELVAENQTQAQDIGALEGANAILTGNNERMQGRIERLDADLTEATSRNVSLSTELRELETAHADLVRQTGDITRLERRVQSLRTEIAELQKKRQPLLLESSKGYFRCTGSMEPKITCLDSATYLDNFLPEDIVVGSVIAFRPTSSCDLESDGVVHRVMRVKVDNGVHYYWPKGDANLEDDGCWIPEGNVRGYVIELHKNTAPQNRELRDYVNRASEEADEAWEEYKDKFRAYCGFAPLSGRTCYLSGGRYGEVNRLGNAYDRPVDHHLCWVNAAKNASTRRAGGAPLFTFCLKPVPIFP